MTVPEWLLYDGGDDSNERMWRLSWEIDSFGWATRLYADLFSGGQVENPAVQVEIDTPAEVIYFKARDQLYRGCFEDPALEQLVAELVARSHPAVLLKLSIETDPQGRRTWYILGSGAFSEPLLASVSEQAEAA